MAEDQLPRRNIIIGVDPGVRGSLFATHNGTFRVWGTPRVWDTPTFVVERPGAKNVTEYDLAVMRDILIGFVPPEIDGAPGWETHLIIEQVTQRSFRTGAEQGTGIGWGYWVGMAAAFSFKIHTVHPATWKADVFRDSELKVSAAKHLDDELAERARVSKRQRELKTASRLLAQALFPECAGFFRRARDDGRAESALLTHWLARELEGGWAKPTKKRRPE